MRILCIDIETTGLDPETCQIIELGALIGDCSEGTIEAEYSVLVKHDVYQGEAFALQMNSQIFKEIADAEKIYNDLYNDKKVNLVENSGLVRHFGYFLADKWQIEGYRGTKPTVAGKNFAN